MGKGVLLLMKRFLFYSSKFFSLRVALIFEKFQILCVCKSCHSLQNGGKIFQVLPFILTNPKLEYLQDYYRS